MISLDFPSIRSDRSPERTYGWFGGWRRLDREYERRIDSSETMVRFDMLRIVLNRLD
jgi:putative transposase